MSHMDCESKVFLQLPMSDAYKQKELLFNILWLFSLKMFEPVKNVVLDDEEDIEDDREQAEAKLGRVAEDRAPII